MRTMKYKNTTNHTIFLPCGEMLLSGEVKELPEAVGTVKGVIVLQPEIKKISKPKKKTANKAIKKEPINGNNT